MPHRRLERDSRGQIAGAQTVCPDIARAEIAGFTLIEMSIVLVIIGLIVGGILFGRDLIGAAGARAQITQLDKFNAAVNTFRGKYGYLPGDLVPVQAALFNFPPANRPGTQGEGDGNGVLEAYYGGQLWSPSFVFYGETAMFWGDLTSAGLIEGSFTKDQTATLVDTSTGMGALFPTSKISQSSYVTVYSNGGTNYFEIVPVFGLLYGIEYQYSNNGYSFSVAQAAAIDRKMDDGLAATGNVKAQLPLPQGVMLINASSPDTSTSCFNSSTKAYSVSVNNGAGVNCALSFQFQ